METEWRTNRVAGDKYLGVTARTVALTIGNIRRGMSAEMGKLDREMRAAVDVRPSPHAEPVGPAPGQECEDSSEPKETGNEPPDRSESTRPANPDGPAPS